MVWGLGFRPHVWFEHNVVLGALLEFCVALSFWT